VDHKEMKAYLEANWLTGRVADMAKHIGVSEQKCRRIAIKLKLGPRPERGSQYDPSRLEIKRRAAEVRSQWTPEERARRVVGSLRAARWTPPTVRVGDIEAPSYARI
jgi:hypothetical protein